MLRNTVFLVSQLQISLKILEKFPEVLERVSFELDQQKNQFRISMETPVENPLMTIESFNRQLQIGEKERELAKLGSEEEMGKTMFHVANAYTRAAQFVGLSAEASYRLQKLGGMVLGMVK
jgi:hypothetical protein